MGLQLTRGGEYAIRAMTYLAYRGFSLARPPAEITVRDVVEAVDGPIALNGCVLWPEDCRRSADCRMHEVWVLAQQRMMDVLGEVTLAQLAPAPAPSPA